MGRGSAEGLGEMAYGVIDWRRGAEERAEEKGAGKPSLGSLGHDVLCASDEYGEHERCGAAGGEEGGEGGAGEAEGEESDAGDQEREGRDHRGGAPTCIRKVKGTKVGEKKRKRERKRKRKSKKGGREQQESSNTHPTFGRRNGRRAS